MIPLDSFVGQSADGKMVPIIPGGNSIPLTFSNRKEYVERAIEYRLHEMDRQVSWNVGTCMWMFTVVFKQELTGYCWVWVYELPCQLICICLSAPVQRLFRPYLWVSCLLTQSLRTAPNWSLVGLRPSSHPGLYTCLLTHPSFCLSSSLTVPNPGSPTLLGSVRAHVNKPLTLVLRSHVSASSPTPAAVPSGPSWKCLSSTDQLSSRSIAGRNLFLLLRNFSRYHNTSMLWSKNQATEFGSCFFN